MADAGSGAAAADTRIAAIAVRTAVDAVTVARTTFAGKGGAAECFEGAYGMVK